MSNARLLIVGGLLIEVCAGLWLWNKTASVTSAETAVGQREMTVLIREEKASQREKAVKSNGIELATLQSDLKSRESKLTSESAELTKERNRFTKEKKDEEEEKSYRTYALDLVRSSFDRLRENVYKKERSDQWGFAGGETVNASVGSGKSSKDGVPANQLKVLESRYVRVEQSKPQEQFAVAGRLSALTELSSACAELMSRGSIDALQLQAVIEFDLRTLREFGRQLGLPEDLMPKNVYELLESSQLAEFEALQIKKLAFLKQQDTAFSGLYKPAIEEVQVVLKRIQDAKGKRPNDPAPAFAKAILTKKLEPADVAALRAATTGEARSAAIELLHAKLLAKSMAIQWYDVATRQRFNEVLARLSPEMQEKFRSSQTHNFCLELVMASTPADPQSLLNLLREQIKIPKSVSEAVTQYVSQRYSDPVRSSELYILLKSTYLATNGNLLTSQNQAAFKQWMAGHLTPGQAYELVVLKLDPLVQIFAELKAINDPRLNLANDRNEVEETRVAFLSEAERRPQSLKSDEPRLSTKLAIQQPDPQEMYNIFSVMLLRAKAPELKKAWTEKALDGLSAQLATINAARDNAAEAIRKNEQAVLELKQYDSQSKPADQIEQVQLTLGKSYKAIELRLNELVLESPDNARIQTLLTRVKEGLGAIPPPTLTTSDLTDVKAAADWVDPVVTRRIRTVLPQKLEAIEASSRKIASLAEEHAQQLELKRQAIEREQQARREQIRREQQEREELLARERAQVEVDVYGRMTCPRTTQVMELYEKQGVQVRFHDIDSDESAAAIVRSANLKGRLLPLVKVNGRSLNGNGEALYYEGILDSCRRR